jgi:RimJ/RimL family protein N-acetyltransferase
VTTSFDLVRTERLELRRLVSADVPAVVAISTDPRTNRHRPGGPPTAAQSGAMCRRFMDDWERHGLGYWTVRCEDRIVGIAGVMAV